MLKPEILFELFRRANEEELGIAIEATNPTRLQNYLDMARKQLDTAHEYSDLTIALSSKPNQLYIVKPTVSLHDLD